MRHRGEGRPLRRSQTPPVREAEDARQADAQHAEETRRALEAMGRADRTNGEGDENSGS